MDQKIKSTTKLLLNFNLNLILFKFDMLLAGNIIKINKQKRKKKKVPTKKTYSRKFYFIHSKKFGLIFCLNFALLKLYKYMVHTHSVKRNLHERKMR